MSRWLPRGFGRIGFVALLLATLLLGWQWMHRPPADPVVGQVLALDALPKLGARVTSSGPRLVNLFASWCVPCRAEAPVLAALARSGVVIDGIAVRDPEAASFLHSAGDPYADVRVDPRGQVQAALGSGGLPETYVVDAGGVIVYRHRGAVQSGDAAELRRQLQR